MASCTARLTLVALTTAFREAQPAAASAQPLWRSAIPTGWDHQPNPNTSWRTLGETAPGTYFIVGNAEVTANTGGPGGASSGTSAALSLLAMGSITANGNPAVVPHATIPFIGPILMIAGHDLDLGADFDAAYEGLFYARHQLDIAGSPILNGQVIALNKADTAYENQEPGAPGCRA